MVLLLFLSCAVSPVGLRCTKFHWELCPVAQQHRSLLRWSMTWLTERLPPVCPLSLGTEWVDMVSSSHNKHFSKWASSDDKLGHIECPTVFSSPSLWWCCPTKTLLSSRIAGGYRGKKMFLETEQTSSTKSMFLASYTQLDMYNFLKLLQIFSLNSPQIIMLSLQFQSHIWHYMS